MRGEEGALETEAFQPKPAGMEKVYMVPYSGLVLDTDSGICPDRKLQSLQHRSKILVSLTSHSSSIQ